MLYKLNKVQNLVANYLNMKVNLLSSVKHISLPQFKQAQIQL